MKKIIFVLVLLIHSISFSQKVIYVEAKPTSVIVYRNAAEILNSISVNLPEGISDVVVTNIASYGDENSVRVAARNSITILSVQRTNQSSRESEIDEADPRVKKVRDSIKIVTQLLNKNDQTLKNNELTLDLLEKNKAVLVGSNTATISELSKWVEFYQNKRNELEDKMTKTSLEREKLNEKLAKLERKISNEDDTKEKIAPGKFILRIMNKSSGLEKIEFSYLTQSVSWQPFYELKADSMADNIKLTYNASIQQTTGLDWKGVKLSLVSTNAGQMNQMPNLSPWFLHAYKPQPKNVVQASGIIRNEQNYSVAEVSSVGYSSSENILSTRFDTEIPYDILANGKSHSVRLLEHMVPAKYQYYAVPKLDKNAYLVAEISDYAQYNLLPGKANIIFENVYVGSTQINPQETGNTMKITLGKDEKIAITREKINDKSNKKVFSSNIEQSYAFNITIRNNKKTGIRIELKDQIPISPDANVEVKLENDGGGKLNLENGILVWDLNLAPAESKKMKVEYLVKYPKDFEIQQLN